MDTMTPMEQFPDELFYGIFETEDLIERQQYLESLRTIARKQKRIREFDNIYKAFVTDYIQKMKQTGNETQFTDQPIQLFCGQWSAKDTGVSVQKFDSRGFPFTVFACPHPIMPIEILKNVDTSEERITLAYFKNGYWQKITVGRSVCANAGKIVDSLSPYGIEVTSENKDSLVRYISDCVGMNPAILEPKRSINRLGWIGAEFMPYADDIVYEGDRDFEVIYKNIHEAGSFDIWKSHCQELRKNKIVRIAFAVSAASVLIEPLNVLPFVFHIWSGTSGTAKTVAIMTAMSIWGNPKMGGLVKTMNTTKVNIMRTSAFLYSLPFAGDELQTMKDKWTTNFDQLIYQITEGIDRGRGKASGGVEETKTWRNTYLFTGEEPITKVNSRSGSKNRVIEIEITEKLIEDGNYTVNVLTQNYGFAGKKLIDRLGKSEKSDLQKEYKELFDTLCKLDTTEKQAMSMACILLADKLLTECIFTDETPLQIEDVKEYLRTASEVDVSERAYQAVLNWIAKNPVRFADPKASDSINKGEVWGKIDDNTVTVNKDVLCEFLEKSGMDYAAVSRKWASEEKILKNSQGKYVHQTKVYGIKASYVKIAVEDDGFMEMEGQMEIPFD
jgi:uncharacterized protein (DUF927 family)